jgi:hypothetical protein
MTVRAIGRVTTISAAILYMFNAQPDFLEHV